MIRIIMFLSLVVGMGQVFAAWDGTSREKPAKEGNYCIIDSEAKLAWYASDDKENNYAQCNAKLTADLDLGKKLWTPIAAGTGDQKYSKIFDGNGHIIKNLYINGSELAVINKKYAQNLGFVGVLGSGTVKNLTLEDVDIQASTNAGDILVGKLDQQISVGAFVGWMNESASNLVETCMVTGSIKTTGNGQGVGGIVGNAKKGTISNCLSLVEIQASGSDAYVGGIIGIIKIEVYVLYSVYAGPGVKTGLDGAVGAIAGYVSATQSYGKFVAKKAYYEDETLVGIGKIDIKCSDVSEGEDCNEVSDGTKRVKPSNTNEVVSLLNDAENVTKPWSVGNTKLVLNGYGPDGYRIVFDANGGAFTGDETNKDLVLEAGQKILASEVEKPLLESKSFTGWASSKDATKPETELGTVSAPVTLYAVWAPVYKITFDVTVPGTETVEKVIEVAEGDAVTVDDLGELSTEYCKKYDEEDKTICKTYSYIAGWASSSEATENDIVDLNTVPASEGLKLYAVWKDTDVETYTVTLNANQHGQSDENFVHVEAGKKVTELANPTADEGYEFVGWFTDEAGATEFDFTKPVEESDVLYAKWKLTEYEIKYVLNGATNSVENPSSYTIESETIVLKDPTPAEGYDFEGWFYDAKFTQKATQIISGSSGKKELYAKCVKKTYKVTYLADNNSYGSVSDQIKEHGTDLNLESEVRYTRAGYEQIGWSNEAEGEKVYDLGAVYKENAPITLYPAWEKKANQITYVLNGGDNNSENVDSYSEQQLESDAIELKKPYKCGYRFDGWFDNDKFTGSKITQIAKGTTGDLKLYAKWSKLNPLDSYGPIKIYSDGLKCAILENVTQSRVPNTIKNVKVGYVTYDRTFPVNRYDDDKMYSTIMLPFSIDKSKVDGAEFFEFKGVANEGNEKEVQVSALSGDKVLANKPYIIRTTKAKLSFNIGEGETVTLNTNDRSNSVVTVGQWKFRGTYEYKKWTAKDSELGYAYGYAAKAAKNLSVGEFARNAAGAFIYPFRAYLLYTPKAKAAPQYASNSLAKTASLNQASIDGVALPETMKIVIVDGKQESIDQTPAFNMLNTVLGPVKFRNGWFDMKGRKLNGKPTAKGVYYYNGKRIRIY